MPRRPSWLRTGVLGALLVNAPSVARAQARPSEEVDSDHATVWLHVESDRPVDLLISEPDESPFSDRRRWTRLCSDPCDLEVPTEATYRLDGEGIRATAPFRLAGRDGQRVVVTLEATSTRAFVGATIMEVAGFITLGVGAIVALTNARLGDGEVLSDKTNPAGVIAGVSCFIAGAAAAAIGITLKKESTVRQSGAAGYAPLARFPPKLPVRRADAAPTQLTAGTVREVMIPLWTTSF